MKSFTLIFREEKAELSWRNNQIHASGYDLESEHLAMILAGGQSDGIGALLLCIDELILPNSPLSLVLAQVNEDLADLSKIDLARWRTSKRRDHIVYAYLSFSRNLYYREFAARYAVLVPEMTTRLLKDPELSVRIEVIKRATLSRKNWEDLSGSPFSEIRKAMLRNTKIPKTILRKFLKDSDVEVRKVAVQHFKCDKTMLKAALNDPDDEVVKAVFVRYKVDMDFLKDVAAHGSVRQKKILAKYTIFAPIWKILEESETEVQKALRGNFSYATHLGHSSRARTLEITV